MRRWIVGVGLVAAVAGPVACDDGAGEAGDPSGELLVLAASDLALALDELARVHEERTGVDISVVLGSTGSLAAQIRHGAPADLFFSADTSFLDGLIEADQVDPATRTAYAVGRLALVAPAGRPLPPTVAALADGALEAVAIANPDHAPYGRAARAALEEAGVWEEIAPRLVLGESVAHALQFVRTGNADAGLVALSLVHAAGDGADEAPPAYRVVDADLHPPLRQVAGVVRASTRPEEARAFLAFVSSPEGRAILRGHGFEAPGPAGPNRPGKR
ncbi:MAG: molybdate ABC transporter substrate-binding protein [Gemmatimonadota bacterium]|nr:molybdate ABC transporter substrate-binding protein [Gemmatimonadota bacterium]